MKIIIFGTNGMLGNYCFKYLKQYFETIPLTRNQYDINNLNIDSLTSLLNKLNIAKTDIILNCAGIIPQSNNRHILTNEMYYKINSIFPILLSNITKEIGCKMIHITTDCIFDGKIGNYNENSIHSETNDYGVSKYLGEFADCCIIRTSIIGEELYNKTSLLEWVISNENKEINGYINHLWNGITCLQLSKIIKNIIIANMYWLGVRHIFSPTIVSKYELVSYINEIYELNIKINKYETNIINKSLDTIYHKLFNIPNIYDQITEQRNFKLNQD
jgi:dTDP-4-dehydrorhamnose reductase